MRLIDLHSELPDVAQIFQEKSLTQEKMLHSNFENFKQRLGLN